MRSRRTVTPTISNLLIRWRFVGLGCAVIAAGLAYVPAAQLGVRPRDREHVRPGRSAGDPLRAAEARFSGARDRVGRVPGPGAIAPDGAGIRRCAAIRQRLAAVPGVKGVLGIDVPLGPAIADPESGLGQRYLALFQGYTHGQDGQTAALVCVLAPVSEHARRGGTRSIGCGRSWKTLPDGLAPGMLAGEPVMVVDGFRYVEADGRRLGVASTLLLAAVIIVCFRSVRWVVIPLAVVQLTLVLTRGILQRQRSASDYRQLDADRGGHGGRGGGDDACDRAVSGCSARGQRPRRHCGGRSRVADHADRLGLRTDAAGFASLMIADVGPVHDYGLMMAIGSLLVLVTAALLVPGMALLGRWDVDPREAWGERLLDVPLDRSAAWTRRYPLQVRAGGRPAGVRGQRGGDVSAGRDGLHQEFSRG